MTDHSKLKSVCEALIAHSSDSFYTPCAMAFERAATPAVVLGLIAEVEAMSEFKAHMDQLRETHGFESWTAVLVENDSIRQEAKRQQDGLHEMLRRANKEICRLRKEKSNG